MTLSVRKHQFYDGNVEIRCTSGQVDFTLTEPAGHARSFHTDLGRVLDHIEGKPPKDRTKTPGQRAYDAYVERVGGRAVNGDELPSWEGLSLSAGPPDKIRDGWEAAAAAV